jgi:alpha-D-ribose 1-methylphosphonate 5-triphosphate synthase subunit PhnH
MNSKSQLCAGFTDSVHDAQHAFRSVLDALARPGRRLVLGQPIHGLELGPAMAHLLLALTDDDTAVWWQPSENAAPDWLRFHTGASVAATPDEATFAVLISTAGMPSLDRFSAGTLASPDHSATLLVEVPSLYEGPALEWRGPGIQETQTVRIAGLPENFWAQWQVNHAAFPQGVDIVFTCADAALGLPRTTRVRRLEGV